MVGSVSDETVVMVDADHSIGLREASAESRRACWCRAGVLKIQNLSDLAHSRLARMVLNASLWETRARGKVRGRDETAVRDR